MTGRERPLVDFRLLGPLEWRIDEIPQPLPGAKPRALLAALLINRNRVVSSEGLADAVWNDDPPTGYPGTLQVYVSTLRKMLRTSGAADLALISTQAPGYKLSVDEDLLDLGRFNRAVATGNDLLRGRRFAEAVRRLSIGLDQWSGPALADLRGSRFADEFATAVQEDRLTALSARIEADLALGNDSAVIAELTALTSAHPLREPFWAQLITALYRLGRQADALAAARRIRALLADELGIDPGPALQNLERRILQQESLNDDDDDGRAAGSVPTVSETAVVLSTARVVLPSGESVRVPTRGLRIGRMEDNDVVIDSVKASRYHAVIAETAGGFAVNDLRSTNGTLVGGQRVHGSHLVRDGDTITVGGSALTFHLISGVEGE